MVNKTPICLLVFILICMLTTTTPLFCDKKNTLPEKKHNGDKQENLVNRETKNTAAFGRLYGYVRYFHPSDEAAKLDWDRFAIYGAKKAAEAKTTVQLKRILEKLFLPIAPTMKLYLKDDETKGGFSPAKLKEILTPIHPQKLDTVVWQHQGLRTGDNGGIYKSIRVNREMIDNEGYGVCTLKRSIDAKMYRGRKIWLKAMVKTARGQARLFIDIDRLGDVKGLVDKMEDRPIKNDEWSTYSIQGRVAIDAETIHFGCILPGEGQIYVDHFQLMVNENARWKHIKLKNNGFENAFDKKKMAPAHWAVRADGYHVSVTTNAVSKGRKCLFMASKNIVGPARLFKSMPKVGEYTEKEIGQGIVCLVPLALYSSNNRTYPTVGDREYKEFLYRMKKETPHSPDASGLNVRRAGVLIVWNVFQHFYPFFNGVNMDWNKKLEQFLEAARDDENELEFLFTLREMTAALDDCLATVHHPLIKNISGFPFKVEWIENRVVITDSQDMLFERGDIIKAIDGVDIKKYLEWNERYISGSPQWKRQVSMRLFGQGKEGTAASLTVLRGTKVYEFSADRNMKGTFTGAGKDPVTQVRKGIYYIDLDKVELKYFQSALKHLSDARGIVFDARGYVDSQKRELLGYLTDTIIKAPPLIVPRIAYPDRQNIEYLERSWNILPASPRITATCVFLSHGYTISASESFLSVVKNYRLGEILGQPTAGANGNINKIVIPGDYTIIWSGMRAGESNGKDSRQAIKPTIPVKRSLKGVREGRDELLERALDYIEKHAAIQTKNNTQSSYRYRTRRFFAKTH